MKVFMIGTITFILFLIGLPSYSQEFKTFVIPNLYQNDFLDQVKPGQAVLSLSLDNYTGGITEALVISQADISKGNFDSSSYIYSSASGRFRLVTNPDGSVSRQSISLIDASTFYVQADVNSNKILLTKVQNFLETKNLGTVDERFAYISLLNGGINPEPIILVHYIKPWVVIGFAIFLSLPMWWVVKRALR